MVSPVTATARPQAPAIAAAPTGGPVALVAVAVALAACPDGAEEDDGDAGRPPPELEVYDLPSAASVTNVHWTYSTLPVPAIWL
jgi:hypothetical protein